MYSNEQAKNVTFRTDERMTYGAMNYDGAELMEQLLAQKVSLAQQPAVQTPIPVSYTHLTLPTILHV